MQYQNFWSESENTISCFEYEYADYPEHFHNAFEFIYISSGKTMLSLGGRQFTLGAGEGFLILPNTVHSYKKISTQSYTHGTMMIFSPESVPEFYKYIKGKQERDLHGTEIHGELARQLREWNSVRHNIFETMACAYMICAEFYEKMDYIDFFGAKPDLAHRIINIIQERYTTQVSLQSICAEVGYDYHYLSRYINNTFHMSFLDILNKYRMDLAVTLLRSGNHTIAEISSLCGYENVRSFDRNFRKIIGTTPSKYRLGQEKK